MLTLRHSPSSPFVRKIRIGASVLGLDQRDPDRTCRHHEPRRQRAAAFPGRILSAKGTWLISAMHHKVK